MIKYQLAIDKAALDVEGVALSFTLLIFRKRTLSRLVVMSGAKSHHVFRTIVVLNGPRNDVVVLNDGCTASAAAKASFLAKLAFHSCWYHGRTALISHPKTAPR